MFRLKNVPPFSWIWRWWWDHFQCRVPEAPPFYVEGFGWLQYTCSRTRHHLGQHQFNRTDRVDEVSA